MENVSLTISKEIVTPIVQAKINAAVLEALGGGAELIDKVLNTIMNQKVDSTGRVNQYNSENTKTWLDVVITNQIKKAVEDSTREFLNSREKEIKDAIIKHLSNKKGIERFAESLIEGSAKMSTRYNTDIKFSFNEK